MTLRILLLLLASAVGGASLQAAAPAPAVVDPLVALRAKPLYQFTESEVGLYLAHLQQTEPDLRRRILHLARKNIGQPYDLYLLGEMPFETYDPQPLYCLTKSDCLVFSEHVYAMALSSDWTGFMRLLQRIRYINGEIGVVTRNHYTESDWNPSNRWLVRDITAEIAGDKAVRFEEKIDRSRFLLQRYKLKVDVPVVHHHDLYLPYTEVARAAGHLKDGDFVNVVRGVVKPGAPVNDTFGGNAWIGHVGLVAHGPDGTLHMIHSAEPAVREEPLSEFISRSTVDLAAKDKAGKQRLLGFKFLRLEENPLANLRLIDGDQAPRVTLPGGRKAGL
ncbi:MAG: DUF1460 domain-containing protein [Opitutaceae bacterium]